MLFVQLETLSGCSARPPVEAEASDVDVAAPSPAEQQVDGIPPQRTPATLRRERPTSSRSRLMRASNYPCYVYVHLSY